MRLFCLSLLAGLALMASPAPAGAQGFDLRSFNAFVDARTGTGEPVYWYSVGTLRAFPSGELLANVEGYDTSLSDRPDPLTPLARQFSRKIYIYRDAETNEVLMVAYMNEESLRQTLEIGEAVYFSRSRQQLWHKGATSGHTQTVEKILTDCDQDALVLKVRQHGPGCCHAGYRSCFYRNIQEPGNPVALGREIADQSYDPDKVYH